MLNIDNRTTVLAPITVNVAPAKVLFLGLAVAAVAIVALCKPKHSPRT